ncbi:MAG: DEAD/DEAH box helicase, partial [Desulfobacterales bacterium]
MINRVKKIESLLPRAMCADRHAVSLEIMRIKQSRSKTASNEKIIKKLIRLEKKIQTSIKKKSWRKKNRPEPTYNETLPITAKKVEIIDSILKNKVVIISGETGSGKTTQIPKFCLAAGRGIDGKIGCTQPRRIAATTVSRRIAQELGEELGRSVGYKIRFQDKTSRNAYIKIMTDGILLAETQNDPHLNEYDTIIVDEAHERNLNIDFILGLLKTLLKQRKDLKIVITSATIDTEKFSKAFGNAPVIEVSGRMYPVEERYFPVDPKF